MPEVAVKMSGINKSFGGVSVLKDIFFEVSRGEGVRTDAVSKCS